MSEVATIKKPKRYQRDPEQRIAAEIQAAKALKIALGADAEDEQLYHDMIEGETSLTEMIDAIFEHIQQDEELLDGIVAREADLKERKARIKDRQDYRRAKIEQALLIYGEKIERPEATFSLAQRPAKVIVTDEHAIPSGYWKMVPELDRDKLRKDLADQAIPGALLNNAPQTLTIRRK